MALSSARRAAEENSQAFYTLLSSNIEILLQGRYFLEALSEDDYSQKFSSELSSSIGEHFRHLLDVFYALRSACDISLIQKGFFRENMGFENAVPGNSPVVDYNFRRRNSDLESSRDKALLELQDSIAWHEKLRDCADTFSSRFLLTVVSEVSICSQQSVSCESNLTRELVFVALHAIHHYALIKVISLRKNLPLPENFGIAPATASYLRKQN